MFKPQFTELVRTGFKRQTIRPTPKRIPCAGERESWRKWSGKPYRSPQIELAQVELTGIERICISETANLYEVWLLDRPLNGALMTSSEWEKLAKDDGFSCMYEMAEWFKKTHGLPFEGILITAKDIPSHGGNA